MQTKYYCHEQIEKPFGPFDLVEISPQEFMSLCELSGTYLADVHILGDVERVTLDRERYTGCKV